jgi:hypothetical protein
MNDECGGIWKETVMPYFDMQFRYLSTKTLNQNSQCSNRDSNTSQNPYRISHHTRSVMLFSETVAVSYMKKNLRGFSLQEKYTDRATAIGRRS